MGANFASGASFGLWEPILGSFNFGFWGLILGFGGQFWAPEANSILGLVGEKFWVLGANLGFGGKFFVDQGEFVQLFGPFGISWAGGGRTFEVALYGLLS